MEILYYTVTAVVLFLLAAWLLDRIETAYGRRFKLRSLIFFVIMLVLALFVSQIARLFF